MSFDDRAYKREGKGEIPVYILGNVLTPAVIKRGFHGLCMVFEGLETGHCYSASGIFSGRKRERKGPKGYWRVSYYVIYMRDFTYSGN